MTLAKRELSPGSRAGPGYMLRNVHDAHSPQALCRGVGVHSAVCIECLIHALVEEPLLGVAEAVVHDASVAASEDQQLAWQLASAVSDSDHSAPLLAQFITGALASRSIDRSFCDKVLNLSSCLCRASHTFWSTLVGTLAQSFGAAAAPSTLFDALADIATHFPAAQMPLSQFTAYAVDAATSALRAPQPRDVASAAHFVASIMGHRQSHDSVCHAVAAASPALASAATAALLRWPKVDDARVACYELLTALTTARLADLAACTDVGDAAQSGRWPIMDSIQTALLSSTPGVRVASARLCRALCSAGPGDLCAAAVEECHLSEHLFEALRPTHGPQHSQEDTTAEQEMLQACTAALRALASHQECGPALGARLSVGAPALAARLRAALACGDFQLAGRVALCIADILTAAAEGTQCVALARHQALGLAHALADGLAFIHNVIVSGPAAAGARPHQPLMALAPRLCAALTTLVRTALQTFGADVAAVCEPACRCAAGVMASAIAVGCGEHTGDGGVEWLENIAPTCDLVAAFTAICRSGGASTSHAMDVAAAMCMLADTQLVPACMRAAECHPALHCDQGTTSWCASWFAMMTAFLARTSAVPSPMRAELALKLGASRGVALALKVASAQPASRPAVCEWLEALLGAHPATQDLMPAGHSCTEAMLHITHTGASLDAVLAAVRTGTSDAECRALFLLLYASLHGTSGSGMQPMPSCGASCHAAQAALGAYITSAAVARLTNAAWCTVLVHMWASCCAEGHHSSQAEATLLNAYVRAVDAGASTVTPAGNSNTCRWLFSCISADNGVKRHCEALMAAWVTRPRDEALDELLRTDAGACGVLLDNIVAHAGRHGGGSKAVLAGALDALNAAAWNGADAVADALRPRLVSVGDSLFDIMLQPASQEVTPPLMRALCALLLGWSSPPPLGQRFGWTQAGICAAAAVEQGANAAAAAPIGGDTDVQVETLVMPCAQLLACSIKLDGTTRVAREPTILLAVAACLQPRSPLACRAIGACLAAQLALMPGACADLCSRTRGGLVVARQLAQCALHRAQGDNAVQAQEMAWAALAALCLIVEQCGALHAGVDADLASAAAHAHAAGAPPHATHRTRAMGWRLMRALTATGYAVASAWTPFLAQEAARHVTEVASLNAAGCDDPDARVSATEAAGALAAVLQASPAAATAVPAPLATEAASAAAGLSAAPGGVMQPPTPDRLLDALLPPWPPPTHTTQADAMQTQ